MTEFIEMTTQSKTLRKRNRHNKALQNPSSKSGLFCNGSISAQKEASHKNGCQ